MLLSHTNATTDHRIHRSVLRTARIAAILLSVSLTALSLTGCKNEEADAVTAYGEEMSTFFDAVAASQNTLNAIDPNAEDAQEQLLGQIDTLKDLCQDAAQVNAPEGYNAVQEMASQAAMFMEKASEGYHDAFEGETFNEEEYNTASENLESANDRITYMVQFLHGEIPEPYKDLIETEDTEDPDPAAE